jgi:two-component system chemotaxis sensor kinase CheA
VRRVGGDVAMKSEIGRFTSVEMRLPIRVSARDVLLVQAADEWYAIPLDSVRRTMSIASKGLQTIRGTPAIVSDEQLVPLLPLAELLGRAHQRSMSGLLEVVVLVTRGHTGALLVDAIGQRYQVTVKALDSCLATEGIGGATVLADGRVVLVLEPELLLNTVMTCS